MSVLVVGMSHRSAPIELLERVSLDPSAAIKLSHLALEAPSVSESAVVSTCNRVEIYVETDRFHGAVEEVSRLLAEHAHLDRDELVSHVYVHYDDSAVAHLFAVASGLDSMIIGESQILGQVRDTLLTGQAESTVGSALNALFQQALRIGKRGHAETGIDHLAPSIATAALDAAGEIVTLPTTRFVVVGAGAMAVLAVRSLVDRGVDPARMTVVNRTTERGEDLAESVGATAADWADLDRVLVDADVIISCVGAAGIVLNSDRLAAASANGPVTVLDLALPRDVARDAAELPGVTVVDLAVLAERTGTDAADDDVSAVRAIVDDELRTFLAAKASSRVTPTVVALRSMATSVVESEAERLATRMPDLRPDELDEVRRSLQRIADKLIHAPTVRVQELIDGPAGLTYAEALTDLFALDPAAVEAVTRVGGDVE
ncbi:MAG TPA: glutamyl-tRNA reductase [Aeromicrobium sp.]|nr:glutamyl-tRNA reductase [Aeromicrobium sp.]